MNTDERAREFTIGASGIPGLKVVGVAQPVALDAASTRLVPIRLQAPSADEPAVGRSAHTLTRPVEITIEAVDDAHVARHEKSTFAFPR
jgi:hypothetical protein